MAALALMLASLGITYAQSFAEQCQNFQISIPDVQVNVLEFVPNGTNLTFPYDVRLQPTQQLTLSNSLLRTRHAHPSTKSSTAETSVGLACMSPHPTPQASRSKPGSHKIGTVDSSQPAMEDWQVVSATTTWPTPHPTNLQL